MAFASSTQAPGHRASLERPLAARALSFDLSYEISRLRQEPEWTARGHNARTLAKYPDTRVVLAVMKKGTRLATHETDERMTLHPLLGRVRVWFPGGDCMEIGEDTLATLDRATVRELEALEECAFLLTVTWTRSQ